MNRATGVVIQQQQSRERERKEAIIQARGPPAVLISCSVNEKSRPPVPPGRFDIFFTSRRLFISLQKFFKNAILKENN